MKFIFFLIGIILYKFALDVNYIEVVEPVFGYHGFHIFYDLFSVHNGITYLILSLFTWFVYRIYYNKSIFIRSFVLFMFLARFVPLMSLMGLIVTEPYFIALELIFMLCILIFIYYITSNNHNENTSNQYINYSLLFIIVVFCSVIVIIISGLYAGFRLNFDLLNVYELRMDIRESNIPSIIAYIWAPIGNILPVTFILYMIKKKIKICIFIAFIIFLNFSIDGLKSNIFKLFVAVLFYIFYNRNLLLRLPYILTGISAYATLEFLLFKTFTTTAFITYRIFFFPPILDTVFFDYIYKNGPLYYTLRNEFAFMIGDIYFNKPEMRANNGLFSDAYMNLGNFGIILYPLFYAILLKISDKVLLNLESKLVIFISFIIFNIINSSTLSVALLTHGLVVLMICIYFITHNRNIRKDINNYS